MKLQKADVLYIVYLNYINIISTLDYSHVLNILLKRIFELCINISINLAAFTGNNSLL